MKILIISDIHSNGGVNTFLNNILVLHKAKHYQTSVIFLKDRIPADTLEILEDCGFSYYLSEPPSRLQRSPYFSLPYEFRNIYGRVKKEKPDLVIVNTFSPFLFFSLFLYPTPLLFYLHTYPTYSKLWHKPLQWMPALLSGRKKLFCTVSEYSKNAVHQIWNIPQKNIDVIYNFYLPSRIGRLPYSPIRKIILTVGHVVEYKQPALWLTVARKITAKFPDIEFVWLGDGDELLRYQQETENEARIHFAGFSDDTASYYDKALVYVQPSRLESFGMALVEASASGIPCIVARVGGMPEIVDDGITGYCCDKDDVEGFASRIGQLISNPSKAAQMGAKGKEKTQQLFTPEVFEEKLISTYKKIIAN